MSATAESMQASARDRVGKGAARALRREGLIPAVIYGEKQPAEPIAVSYKEINRRIHSGHFLTQVLDIEVNGKKTRVLPRDFQLDPVRDYPLHVDFLRLGANTKIAVFVPVHFINEEECPGIRRGGVLNVVRHRVELECPADAIPSHIVADLTGLDINDSLHISSIQLPPGVKVTIDRDFTIGTIAAPAGIKEEIRQAAEAAAGGESESAEGGESEGS